MSCWGLLFTGLRVNIVLILCYGLRVRLRGGVCPRIDANLREKEIGSWFSLAFADKNNCRFLD